MTAPNDNPDATTIHVRQAVAGDDASCAWIVERFTPLLLAQARYRLTGDIATICDPADIVSEVWLRVLPRLDQLSPEERYTPTLVAYLSRAVILQINDVLKKMIRRRAHGAVPPVGGEQPQELTDQRTGIVSAIARGERRDAVLSAIEALPEIDREVVVLRAIEQHSNPMAAEILCVEPGTLAVRYHRALRRLRQQLPDSVFAEFEIQPGETADPLPDGKSPNEQ
ncbi:MAG: sigma-70 family RNA polymerase sigma factor [bacterium]|nr:sigma-70 family RNA polymerase sigma factor [bacterium]